MGVGVGVGVGGTREETSCATAHVRSLLALDHPHTPAASDSLAFKTPSFPRPGGLLHR